MPQRQDLMKRDKKKKTHNIFIRDCWPAVCSVQRHHHSYRKRRRPHVMHMCTLNSISRTWIAVAKGALFLCTYNRVSFQSALKHSASLEKSEALPDKLIHDGDGDRKLRFSKLANRFANRWNCQSDLEQDARRERY